MLSGGCGDIKYSRGSSSTTSSSITSSSPSISVSLGAKTMEEVWKDITLLQDQSVMTPRPATTHNHHHHHQHLHNNPNYTLQDFLARPFNKDPASTVVHGASHPASHVLSLNSGTGFDFLEPSYEHLRVSNGSALNNPFEDLGSSNGLPRFGKKRVQEPDNGSSDRRHKRMIKNRESAVRSRARKQAYTNELELEVAQLMEENARLKSQQEQVQLRLAAAAAAQIPKTHTLHRTSTAPF
ncbi:protein FD-like isoform X1 [Tripterygium wilfordii]|uniref:protein FD-like isoform X1 n=1 Tax=Tripterygium wilfordii TaxID=458696 RepID=UPI0018F7F91B|nr:protein FD-like isoform X1 [Tripterygium wilfordii]